MRPAPELDAIEIACGTVLDRDRPPRRPAPRLWTRSGPSSRALLEGILLDHLNKGPVSLSFSGGRDSSLLLALATTVARREGLPDPLPITMRHDSPGSQEDGPQEAVVRHLGLRDWVRLDIGQSLDVLGAIATDFLRREGLVSPPNAYLHLSMAAAAPGGTLLTGAGGDEVLGTSGWRLARVLTGRVAPRPRDLALLGFACGPTRLRRQLMTRRESFRLPWMRPDAMDAARARLGAANCWSRIRWDVEALYYPRSRGTVLMNDAFERVGSIHGVRIESPFTDEGFVASFAAEVGIAGPQDREGAMRLLGEDVLPEQTLRRRDKAHFAGMIWGEEFRRFVEEWDPETLNPAVAELVDLERLRAEWREPIPWYQTMLLVQQAWLDQRAARPT